MFGAGERCWLASGARENCLAPPRTRRFAPHVQRPPACTRCQGRAAGRACRGCRAAPRPAFRLPVAGGLGGGGGQSSQARRRRPWRVKHCIRADALQLGKASMRNQTQLVPARAGVLCVGCRVWGVGWGGGLQKEELGRRYVARHRRPGVLGNSPAAREGRPREGAAGTWRERGAMGTAANSSNCEQKRE